MALPIYATELFAMFRAREVEERCNPCYIEAHPELTANMRDMLVDWMVTVHLDFRLFTETLYLAVNILDRFLSMPGSRIPRSLLQLVGVGAMAIAGKVEEIAVTGVQDWVTVCSDAYTREQINAVEIEMLTRLDWNLTSPTTLHFLRRYTKAAEADVVMHYLAKYLCELALCDHMMLRFLPSMIAATSFYMARKALVKDEPAWSPALHFHAGYAESDLLECRWILMALLSERPTNNALKAVTAKYCRAGLHRVAKIDLSK